MDGGLLLLRLLRGGELAASLALFGTLLVAALIVLPLARTGEGSRPACLRLIRAALALKLAATLAWLPAQAARMAAPDEIRGLPELLALVAGGTTFGQSLLLRTALFAGAVWLAGGVTARPRVAAAALLAAAALGLQPWLGHAAADGGARLPLLVALHVLAAGAWLGGLVPLALLIRNASGAVAQAAARRFSWIGLVAILTLTATAWLQSLDLIGDVGGWFGTPYGLIALAKTGGLVALAAIAALNKFVLTPRLQGIRARRALGISIGIETAIGLAVAAAAVALATMPPAAHEQAVWPFAWQPDLARIAEPYYAKELWRAAALVGAGVLGTAALLWRRTRLLGPLAAAAAIGLLPGPNLRLLTKPASPTSFQRSETGFTVASIARGEALVRALCTPDCFRPDDDPSDLTPYAVWTRPDGDFYGWLTDVLDRIGHSPFPYGTIARLPPRQRWQLIDYVRARAAGSAVRRTGTWHSPVLAPEVVLDCPSGRRPLSDFRGQVVEVIAGGAAAPAEPPVATVLLTREAAAGDARPTCRTALPDAWTAFALMAGLDPERLDGTRFLIDANGWLRSRLLPETSSAEGGLARVRREELTRIAAAPFAAAGIGTHRH
ncbi:copper resistance D family protein [Methylobacterium sp. ID0610]|uniref:copper resistance D family protein n=1 Tax=Methylobacterium carpenticola TaxID=3344827 RepID=UPI00369C1AE8